MMRALSGGWLPRQGTGELMLLGEWMRGEIKLRTWHGRTTNMFCCVSRRAMFGDRRQRVLVEEEC